MLATQVLLVTKSSLHTEALARILEREKSITLAANIEMVLPLPPAGRPGQRWVVVYDLDREPTSFERYLKELERRNIRCRLLLFGDCARDAELLYYLSLGVHGFVATEQLKNLLIKAIEHVVNGGIWMPHKVVAQFVERVVTDVGHVARLFRTSSVLSRREQEVWQLISNGGTNKDIANRLGIAERTVKFHVAHLLEKLQASNRRELMARYSGSDLFPSPQEAALVVNGTVSPGPTKRLLSFANPRGDG